MKRLATTIESQTLGEKEEEPPGKSAVHSDLAHPFYCF